jgi:EmrB/QacA subfamily drug resistance transporter
VAIDQPAEKSLIAAAVGDEPLPRRKLVFGIVSMALFMASVDQTIVATALTNIQTELHAQINWSSWTITIYAVGQVLMMPLAGKISDTYGRKTVFIVAAIVFTLASLCCGLVNNIYLLVLLRGVQALGGGAFIPSATGIVSDQFGRERDRALGMFTSIFPIGGIVGPVLGGVFVTYWSWRGIFLVNVPIGILLIVLGLKYIPTSARQPSARIDFRGIALIGVLLIAGMLGVAYLGTAGASLSSWLFWLPEIIALFALVGFIQHTRHDADPFISSRLLVGTGFGAMNLINFLFGAGALGLGTLVPLYAEQRYGIKELQAGTLLTARAVGVIAVAAMAAMALRRTGYRMPMVVGFSLMASGLIMLSISPHGLSDYSWLAAAAAVSGLGIGLSVPASNNATLQLAPEQIGSIAGLRGMFRQAGGITALSVITAIVARSATPGITLGHMFICGAVIVALAVPIVFAVPDHRGGW